MPGSADTAAVDGALRGSRTVDRAPSRRARARRWFLVVLLVVAGVTHFVAPSMYERIVPRLLGSPRAWVAASGVAELACALLLGLPRTRRAGGWATAVVFVVIFPANVKMALDAGTGFTGATVAAWLRLPLQVPLVLWAVQEGRATR